MWWNVWIEHKHSWEVPLKCCHSIFWRHQILRIVFWVHFYCCKQCFCFCLSWDLTSRQPFTSSSEIDDVIKVRACIMVGLGTCRPETSVGFKYGVKTNRIAASLYAVLWTCWDLTENAYRCRASLLEQSFWQHVNMTTTMIWQSTTVTSSLQVSIYAILALI